LRAGEWRRTKTPDFIKRTDTIAVEGNKVEILGLDRKLVSFLIKRRVPTGGARIPRAGIRQLEVSTRSFKLTELYYHNEMLTGSRAWVLKR